MDPGTRVDTATVLLFWPDLNERQRLLCGLLRSMGYRIDVISWDRSDTGARDLAAPEGVDSWRRVHIPGRTQHWTTAFHLPGLYSRMRAMVSHRSEEGPIVVAHLALLPVVLRSRSPVIYDASEIFANDMSMYFGRLAPAVRPFFDLAERLLMGTVSAVLVVDSKGGWLRRRYERWGLPTQLVLNVPSRLDDPDPAEVADAAHDYEGRRVVAFAGGLFAPKGLFVSLEACARVVRRHPDVLFVFIGPMKAARGVVEARIRSLGIEQNVRLRPPMSYRRLLAHLGSAQIGLAPYQPDRSYPLRAAGTLRKYFTYMQAGIPIIAPSFGEIGSMVRREHCGVLVESQDPAAVAAAVCALLEHPRTARRMGSRGRSAFCARYNWEGERGQVAAFLGEVLTNRDTLAAVGGRP